MLWVALWVCFIIVCPVRVAGWAGVDLSGYGLEGRLDPWVFPRKSPDSSLGDLACHQIPRNHALGMCVWVLVSGSWGQALALCSRRKAAEDEFVHGSRPEKGSSGTRKLKGLDP